MVEPSFVVPTLGEPINLEPPPKIPEEIDRSDPVVAGIVGGIYTPVTDGGYSVTPDPNSSGRWCLDDICGLTEDGVMILLEERGIVEPIVADEESDVSLLGDIYDVVDTSLGGVLPGGVPWSVPGTNVFTPGWNAPTGPSTYPVVPQVQGGMGPPMPPVPPLACGDPNDPYKGMVYKRVCGQWKWIKKTYRRRKQLFTTRDASQLSSLIGIAGKSQIAKTWIASHPS